MLYLKEKMINKIIYNKINNNWIKLFITCWINLIGLIIMLDKIV